MKSYILLAFILVTSLAVEKEKFSFAAYFIHTGTVTPKEPLKKWDDWDEKGPNELTGMGMREQYLLGYELRRRFTNITNSSHAIDQIYVRMVDHNCTIMSGQAFLRGFLGDNTAILSPSQLKKADPPIYIDPYFKEKIGNKVLPSGISTLPFHTYYPHTADVLDSCSCKNGHAKNMKALLDNKNVKDAINEHEGEFKKIAETYYKKSLGKLTDYVDFLESVWSAIYQYKEVTFTDKEIGCVRNFSSKVYPYARAVNNESARYQASSAFEFLAEYLEKNKNDPNKVALTNRKVAFFFIEDIVMVSMVKQLYPNFEGWLPSASILGFNITGVDINTLNMKVTFNDNEVYSKSYETFKKDIQKFIVENDKLRTYCDK